MSINFDCFDGRELSFFDPIHKLLWSTTLTHNFLDFSIKNSYLIFLTILLKFFQSSKHLEDLYFSNPLWHSLLHHDFECLVILTIFECLSQILSVLCMNSCTSCLRSFLLLMWSGLSLLTDLILVINFDDCLFSGLDVFLKNQNVHHKWSVIWRHSPFRMNNIIVKFLWIQSEKHKINN